MCKWFAGIWPLRRTSRNQRRFDEICKRQARKRRPSARFEKKDNYVLGWDNKEKLVSLNWKSKPARTTKTSCRSNSHDYGNNKRYKCLARWLFWFVQNIYQIRWDWLGILYKANTGKTEQKSDLEKTNDKVKKLQEQLKQVQTDLNTLTNTIIKNEYKEILQIEEIELKSSNKLFW